ncbi:hypothetical protein EMPS_10192 [Entomortierella parvispora]|uniref:F-box domain-containing protein n=1 Tax=Entomortierella parvispora TaxID=205924 RepID=A0A9P3HJU0_9FUNG|nr:hypothetical protein EMPS_10192 [Entomortierella parvispora]
MQSKHPTAPLELPEILYVLVQFLDRPALLQASRVSRSWSKIFSPMLFREIRYQDWKHPGFIDLLRKNLDQVVCLEWRFSRRDAKLRYREVMKQQQQLYPWSQNLQVGGDPRFDTLSRSPSPEPQSSSSSSTTAFETPHLNRICFEHFAMMLSPGATPRLRLLAVQGEMELRRFLISVLPKIPTLTCLRIEDSFSWQKIGIGEILNACQSLESLDCDGSVALQFDDAFLQTDPAPLGACISGDDGQGHGEDEQGKGLFQDPKTATLLSTTSLVGVPLSSRTQNLQILRLHKTSLTDQDLLQLVRQCPELQELFLHQEGSGGTLGGGQPLANADATHQWNWSETFVTEMARACPKLVKIHLSPGCFQSLPENIILRVLAAFPKLRSLGVPFSQFGDETMQEILRTRIHVMYRQEQPQQQQQQPQQFLVMEQSRTLAPERTLMPAPSQPNFSPLTSLDLMDLKGRRLSSSVLQTFFENCPELLHFKGNENLLRIQDMILPESKMYLDQTDSAPSISSMAFQLRPWACLRLETLVIGFGRCRNPVQTYGATESRACCSIRENEDEVVFRQLGRLTKLRRLEILKDAPNWSALTFKGSPAFSLSALKVLQTFRISAGAIPSSFAMAGSMSDPTDRREEEKRQQRDLALWIASAWPCLQTLLVPGSRHQQRNKEWSRLFQELDRSNIRVVPSEES